MSPNILVPIALMGWPALVLTLFLFMPPSSAALTGTIAGWLFLPVAAFTIPGLPDFTKMMVTCASPLLGVALFDGGKLFTWRPGLIDLPMLVWCIVPGMSVVSNELPAYDVLSAVLHQAITWGAPYLIGRIYFGSAVGAFRVARAVLIGGLIYGPLCLYEVVMSPQLHTNLYGFHQHSFVQTRRFGGWRPTVFMQHGLMVGLWMVAAALAGLWLWTRGRQRHIFGLPMILPMGALILTAILTRSAGALVLMGAGVALLVISRQTWSRVAFVALAIVPILYMAVRTTGTWQGEELLSVAASIDPDRADSLRTRLDAENVLIKHALQRPLLGWDGWNRDRMIDEEGNEQAITDGMWIIALSQNGLVGLGALTGVLVLPALAFYRRARGHWGQPWLAGAVALGVITTIYAVDCMFNAMVNPVYSICAGALAGMVRFGVKPDAAPAAVPTQGVRR